MENNKKSTHWADITAEKIIAIKGDKESYTCASGITPSGTVHIGNFREIISTYLVVQALREKGKKVRFIYSWDDYDVFRKVPKNMNNPALLEQYLRCPITMVPDTSLSSEESYARKNETDVEKILPNVGISPEYIYQAKRYRSSYYAEDIKKALEKKEEIKAVLNEYRTTPLSDDWWPISVFSSFTNKDDTTVLSWDGEYGITYKDNITGQTETVDLRTAKGVKLSWRVDWPMRWVKESVDFEPAGKDHHSEGGSFDTSKKIVKIFGGEAPVSFQYDFISIKGRGGKISSSSGEVISLDDVLEIYTPEVCRYMFASTRVNAEFSISFDTDVFKIYEDYDNTERVYFGITPANEKKKEKESRIYELSQVNEIPACISYQIPFRHLTNLLLINSLDVEKTIASLNDVNPSQTDRLRKKAICAKNWIEKYADDEFKWSLSSSSSPLPELAENEKDAIRDVCLICKNELETKDEKEISTMIYDIASKHSLEPSSLFKCVYLTLINREKGPRLAGFLKSIGKEKTVDILSRV